MENLLWISFRVPYDKVAHAGGKIHNYYLKKLFAANKFNIKLISFCNNDDVNKIDLNDYGIDSSVINSTKIETEINVVQKLFNKFYKISNLNNYLDTTTRKMCQVAIKKINALKESGYEPSIVILQWTQIVMILPVIKRIFPNAKIVSIEEDVTFLAAQRRKDLANNALKKFYFKMEMNRIKKLEKKCLENSDLVILNNRKDEKLLKKEKFNANTWVWTPYFQNMIQIDRRYKDSKDILFYGAMNRPENWRSAIWFIENVFLKIKKDGFRFIVVGNKPPQELLKYNSDKSIEILGFVDDIQPYFQESLCLVAPLVLGAGVKIKILEALSSGIPVLTNKIGIEGIYAKDEREFFFCENPDEYILRIYELAKNKNEVVDIERSAKKFIDSNYDFERDASTFGRKLEELL